MGNNGFTDLHDLLYSIHDFIELLYKAIKEAFDTVANIFKPKNPDNPDNTTN